MGLNVGNIDLGLDINKKSFNNQLSGIASGAKKSVSSAFSGLGKKIGVVLGGAAIVGFTKQCIELGSNLTEVQNVVDTTFSTMSESVNEFAKNAIEKFGLSETVAKKYMGTLGTMSKSMGLSEKQAYDMAEAVTGLTGDVASFYNLSSDEAYTKLKSIWTGETESLKDLGVLLTQTNLDQYALNNGFGKTTKEMSEQEKLMLRYQYTMSALGASQGDFAKTSGSWANQVRVLGLRFDSLKATLGQGFINLFTPIIRSVNELIDRLQLLADKFKSFTEMITGSNQNNAAAQTANAMQNAAAGAEAMMNATSATADTAEKINKQTASFDKLNVLSSNKDTSSVASATEGLLQGGLLSSAVGTGAGETENKWVKSIDNIKKSLSSFNNWANKNFVPVFKKIAIKPQLDTLTKNFKSLFTKISKAWEPVSTFITGPFTMTLQTCFSFMGTVLEEMLGIFNTVFGDMINLIKPCIDVFNNNFVPYFMQLNTTMLGILTGLLGSFTMVFTDIWSIAVYPILKNFITLGLPILFDFCMQSADAFGVLFDEVKETFDLLWVEGVNPALDAIIQIWCHCMKTIKEFWDKWGQPVFDGIKELFRNVGETIRNVWIKWIEPVWTCFMETVDELWNKHLQPLLSNFIDFIGEFITGATALYRKFILPVVNWFVDILGPFVTNSLKNIIDTISTVVKAITGYASGLITMFKGIIQFITGVFTCDWDKAWTGVKNIFSGIFNSLVSVAKTPINLIIDLINGMVGGVVAGVNAVIRALNKISVGLPDWDILGDAAGKKFGFNISEVTAPKIKKLAEGGYVKANTPQLAMIGDNRHQGEVIAPEDKLQELLNKASGGVNNLQILEIMALLRDIKNILALIADKDLVAYITSSELFQTLRNEAAAYKDKTGNPAF